MKEIWEQLDTWLQTYGPDVVPHLNPAATPADIAAAERETGIAFPHSLRSSYLVHNGETEDSPGVFDYWNWLSLDRVVEQWHEHVGIQQDYGVDHFGEGQFIATQSIPVLWLESSIRYLAVSNAGGEPPLLELPRHGVPMVVAASFGEYIKSVHAGLVAGSYVVEPDFGYNIVRAGRCASGG
jgi:cell wall assembly regulator SMI1